MFAIGKTDIGKLRLENQDKFRVCVIDDDTVFAVVCDGMGGAASGGLASEMTSNAVYERIRLSYRTDMEPKSVKSLLVSAVEAANAIVYNKSIEDKSNAGMGTTCVTALVHKNLLSITSVGDSRAYLIDKTGIIQITNDHTAVEMLHARGIISEMEMKTHKMKNVITRAVGVDKTVEPDYFEVDLNGGEYVLICTDGLTNLVTDEDIYAMVYKQPIEHAVNELINTANAHGGKDNITAVLISV
ncbi:MAG: Stp1/IreP family PP2C-type Ser/Thr phosphatase [Oscillospiraceae bacterium]|nr:Stp1/IreP family PP2C-type Ser/Thr phosphatase [Oscillospiraceae bacterium]